GRAVRPRGPLAEGRRRGPGPGLLSTSEASDMSRIGKKPVTIPKGVKVSHEQGRKVQVRGHQGTREHTFPEGVSVALEGDTLTIARASDSKRHRAFHGMTRALVHNMVHGVHTPFEKVLEIHGTGYSATVSGNELEL